MSESNIDEIANLVFSEFENGLTSTDAESLARKIILMAICILKCIGKVDDEIIKIISDDMSDSALWKGAPQIIRLEIKADGAKH